MYWDTMDILGYDVMAIAYQIYILYIYVCTLPSAHVDVEAKKSTTNMDVHLVKTIKI